MQEMEARKKQGVKEKKTQYEQQKQMRQQKDAIHKSLEGMKKNNKMNDEKMREDLERQAEEKTKERYKQLQERERDRKTQLQTIQEEAEKRQKKQEEIKKLEQKEKICKEEVKGAVEWIVTTVERGETIRQKKANETVEQTVAMEERSKREQSEREGSDKEKAIEQREKKEAKETVEQAVATEKLSKKEQSEREGLDKGKAIEELSKKFNRYQSNSSSDSCCLLPFSCLFSWMFFESKKEKEDILNTLSNKLREQKVSDEERLKNFKQEFTPATQEKLAHKRARLSPIYRFATWLVGQDSGKSNGGELVDDINAILNRPEIKNIS